MVFFSDSIVIKVCCIVNCYIMVSYCKLCLVLMREVDNILVWIFYYLWCVFVLFNINFIIVYDYS